MRRRPPRSTLSSSSAASDVYKRQLQCFFQRFFLFHQTSIYIFFALLTFIAYFSLFIVFNNTKNDEEKPYEIQNSKQINKYYFNIGAKQLDFIMIIIHKKHRI
eukprot:TRINITY_DN7114_c0_g1_i1.p2 TRINITY_DN7114_c0_g1~~TRINITY_DN7114_c0_g1_i1.p2  ORF type:complete len:103 (+),score=5.16 TRINITY_DN7114_c0_g1_i1:92-400(+)